ncbi:hypothetical protein BV25DRAFT_1914943 [Artomyces pyxidatus]|uniref:Uncharacterized protein n=1 Tax=Artomyces pyxidatus TaxID=48021 RepID=A0ACB8T7F4_9AGAM|nr:hypothetical protein BV25DRAFT_1914943 [Artomyces pyxidatus]
MSFIQSILGDHLIRDAWPDAVGRLAQDKKEFLAMMFHETVPPTFEELCEWAYVHHLARTTNDFGRRFMFLHHPGYTAAATGAHVGGTEITIRFQGFLGQHNLKTFGNWHGDGRSAHRAVQFMELGCGPFVTQMVHQVACIENIKKFVFREILSGQDADTAVRTSAGTDNFLSFQRRVFTKIRDGPNAPPSVLTPLDDPTGEAAAVSQNWRVTSKISFGKKTADGGVQRCSYHILGPGDFVDVTARIDIASVHTEYNVPTIKVFLAPITIVQMCRAEDVPQVMGVEVVSQALDTDTTGHGGSSGGIVFD